MSVDVYIKEITASFHINNVHTFEIFYHAVPETVPVFSAVLRPASFSQGYGTGERLVVTAFVILHIFVPDIALHTDNMFLY